MAQSRPTTRWSLVSAALPVLVALLLRGFVAEAAVIPSGSMIPTLQVGDRIVTLKPAFGLKVPFMPLKLLQGRPARPGEVVVFMDPRDPGGEDMVKRVVAVSGDLVEVRDDVPWVNGRPLPRKQPPGHGGSGGSGFGSCSYLARASLNGAGVPTPCSAHQESNGGVTYTIFQDPRTSPANMSPRRVPQGHLFVMGDCRDNSSDSRVWGTVPHSHVKGKVVGVFWSWEPGEGPRWERWFSRLVGSE